MSYEQNQQQPSKWATAEEIDRGRAIVLERFDRIRKWLAESPPDVLEARFRAEWRARGGGCHRFPAHEWEKAKGFHESEVRHFAGVVANGDLVSQTLRGLLHGKPFAASEMEDDDGIPF
jgi:hypothetical protein